MPVRAAFATDPTRPLGLRFLADAINAPDLPAAWPQLATAHGAPELAQLTTDAHAGDAATLASAVAALRAVFREQDPHAAARALNALMASDPAPTALAELPDGRWALRPALTTAPSAAQALTRLGAFALAGWLAERGRCAWGACAAATCDNVFIDEGRRAPQRFCSTTCATRTRVAQHRASATAAMDATN